jgi:DNA-binding NarL/FixJ family response regulator
LWKVKNFLKGCIDGAKLRLFVLIMLFASMFPAHQTAWYGKPFSALLAGIGIDGLETYKRILEIRPYQKAIILSGFSETDKVKLAQELGAGNFVRKPYVLERLGMAVRKELERK